MSGGRIPGRQMRVTLATMADHALRTLLCELAAGDLDLTEAQRDTLESARAVLADISRAESRRKPRPPAPVAPRPRADEKASAWATPLDAGAGSCP